MSNAEMIEIVEAMRVEGKKTWGQVAVAIGSKSAGGAMKRYQRAKGVGPYAKKKTPQKARKAPQNGPVSSDLRSLLKQALMAEMKQAVEVREMADANAKKLAQALGSIEGLR